MTQLFQGQLFQRLLSHLHLQEQRQIFLLIRVIITPKYLDLSGYSLAKITGTYNFANKIDLGTRRKAILRGVLNQIEYIGSVTLFDSLPGKLDDLKGDWDDLGKKSVNQNALISRLEYRATLGDPADSDSETFGTWAMSTPAAGSPSNLNLLTPGNDKYITSSFATNNAPGSAACYVACFKRNGITYQLAVSGTNRYWRKYTAAGGAQGQGGAYAAIQGSPEVQGQSQTGSGTESEPVCDCTSAKSPISC